MRNEHMFARSVPVPGHFQRNPFPCKSPGSNPFPTRSQPGTGVGYLCQPVPGVYAVPRNGLRVAHVRTQRGSKNRSDGALY